MRRFRLVILLSSGLSVFLQGCSDSTGPGGPPATQIPAALAAGGHHICRILGDGSAFCWGRADAGQVGTDSTPVISAPVRVSSASATFTSIATGGLHTCALTADGEPWCWGQNDAGQTGFPITMNQVCGNPIHGWQCIPSPHPVPTTLRFTSLVAGSGNTCGFGTDDTIYCWGSNASGQLGSATTDLCDGTPCSIAPTALPAQPKLQVLALGSGAHFCGLTADGSAYCWGSNASGQLGIGAVGGNRDMPTVVVSPTRFKAIAVGGQHTCALGTNGEPWCWGGDILPPGPGGVSLSATPVAISSSPSFVELITGAWAACGRTSAGTVYCWGINAYGEMGITPSGLSTRYPTPQQMHTDLRWTSLTGSLGTFCGLTRQEETWCWGFGDYGELGPIHQASSSPVRITGF